MHQSVGGVTAENMTMGPENSIAMTLKSSGSKMPNYLLSTQSIKPTYSFIGLGRDEQKLNHYVDLQDGPSSLQKRDGIPTLYEK